MPGYDAGLTLLLLVDKYDIDSFIVESISYTLLVLFSIADGTRKLVNSVGTNTKDYRNMICNWMHRLESKPWSIKVS